MPPRPRLAISELMQEELAVAPMEMVLVQPAQARQAEAPVEDW
jgi:hypothetical protein